MSRLLLSAKFFLRAMFASLYGVCVVVACITVATAYDLFKAAGFAMAPVALYANAITNLNNTIISQSMFEAFTAAIVPLRAFCRNFSADAVEKGDKIKVPFVSSQDAALDFAGTYTMQNANAQGLDISINKHKFVSWGLTDLEQALNAGISVEMFGTQKGFQLAKAVLQDILSVITNANFGAAAFTGAAGTFDTDDIADLRGVAGNANWPEVMRSLIMSVDFYTAVIKDNNVQNVQAAGTTSVLWDGKLPRLHGFDTMESSLIPTNAENLCGFIAWPTAILVAMRYLKPQDGHDYAEARPITDAASGITTGFRKWYDRDTGTMKNVMECNYGYLKGDAAALKRMVTA